VRHSAPLIIVLGPTGSGKSDLALAIAETFQGEIVNCDSLQLYRYLDIGTAKVPVSERRGIPHHLLDVINPDVVFTAGDYVRMARPVLDDIAGRGRIPVITGGTGFYLRALLNGLFTGPGRDDALREELASHPEELHAKLLRIDPEAAARIHPNDTKKLIRAVEVCLLARKPLTEMFLENTEPLTGFRYLKIGLDPPRELLNDKLNLRCEAMFDKGLVEEVRQILAMGFAASAKAFDAIGYREAILFLEDKLTRSEAIERARISTRQYAKRQRTWFRRELEVEWLPSFGIDTQTSELALRLTKNFVKHF
jgi:tRNA dimethylallyltransferase